MLPSTQMEWIAAAGGAVLAVLGALSARYVAARRRIERSWTTAVERKPAPIRAVDDLPGVPPVGRPGLCPGADESPARGGRSPDGASRDRPGHRPPAAAAADDVLARSGRRAGGRRERTRLRPRAHQRLRPSRY